MNLQPRVTGPVEEEEVVEVKFEPEASELSYENNHHDDNDHVEPEADILVARFHMLPTGDEGEDEEPEREIFYWGYDPYVLQDENNYH